MHSFSTVTVLLLKVCQFFQGGQVYCLTDFSCDNGDQEMTIIQDAKEDNEEN